MHIQFGDTDKETRPRKGLLVLFVITDNMAGVLTEETFDAFAELLTPLNIYLLHTEFAGFEFCGRFKRWNFHRLFVVKGNVGNQIADDRKCTKWRNRDGLALFKHIHAGHAGKTWLTVDLHGA